jgi:hypothetical protein
MPAACIDSSAPARQSYFYDADEDGRTVEFAICFYV